MYVCVCVCLIILGLVTDDMMRCVMFKVYPTLHWRASHCTVAGPLTSVIKGEWNSMLCGIYHDVARGLQYTLQTASDHVHDRLQVSIDIKLVKAAPIGLCQPYTRRSDTIPSALLGWVKNMAVIWQYNRKKVKYK